MPVVRLDKLISETGECSRSQARERIRSGRVAVNGTVVTDPGLRVDSESSLITLDGQNVGETGHIYIMLHKAAGILTATRDPRKPTVLDAMPEAWKRRGLFRLAGWTRTPRAF